MFTVSEEILSEILVVFFFSSRRRHTISLCDWSSDVCSSDLGGPGDSHRQGEVARHQDPHTSRIASYAGFKRSCHVGTSRSEERRVGKECRTSSESARHQI